MRTERFSVAGSASKVPAASRSRVNCGKSLPTPVVVIWAAVAPCEIRTSRDYINHGNCLKEPLDDIWARIPSAVTIIENKRWLSVLAN